MRGENLVTISYLNYRSLCDAVQAADANNLKTFKWDSPDDGERFEMLTEYARYLIIYMKNKLGIK